VQWQYVIETNGSVSSNRTPPHRHPPVMPGAYVKMAG
jgi:hypothetical protein